MPIILQAKNKKCFLKELLCSFALLFLISIRLVAQPNASFTVNQTTGCAPLTIQFTNTSVNATSYYWDFGNGVNSTSANPINLYSLTGSYSVKLVAYGSGSQRDSVIMNNLITVVPSPVANFTAANTSGCENQNLIQFQNLSSDFDSCVWDFGDGITSSVINPSHTYPAAGSYSVTLVVFNTVYNCNHSKTISSYIIIHPKPSSSFTVNQNSTCNQSQVFSFQSNATGASLYQWSFGDASTSASANPSHQYSQPGYYSVSLVVTSSYGCTDSLSKNNFISILSNQQPVISADDSSGCSPFNVNFNTVMNGATSWSWNFGDGYSSSFANPSHQFTTTGNFTTTLTVTYPNGCTNTSYNLPITVSTAPLVQFTNSVSSGCKPLVVQFFNSANNNTTYNWNFGDGNTSTLSNPSYTYNQVGSFIPSLTAVNTTTGCTNQFVLSYPMVVSGPSAAFAQDVTSGCNPLTVSFFDQSINAAQWHWDFGDGSTAIVRNPIHVYTVNGTYSVKLIVTDGNGCSDSIIGGQSILVTSSVSAFNSPGTITGCAPLTVSLSDSSASTSWAWNFGDGQNSTLQSPAHTYYTPGTYNVALNTQSNGSGCSQNINSFVVVHVNGGIAGFTYTQSLCPPYTAWFIDTSYNAIGWLWDFGDGTTSTQQNPAHVYNNPGYYNVTLFITSPDGCVASATYNYAISFLPLSANVIGSTTDTIFPATVSFTSNSVGATAWLWDFGDGGTSTLENPIHIYNSPGPFDITLTISNDSCSRTYVFQPSSFGGGGTNVGGGVDTLNLPEPQQGCPPFTVHFHSPVQDAVSWLWNFGDGGTATVENPTHTYLFAGSYDVTIITQDQNGNTDTLFNPASVEVPGAKAGFSISNYSSCNGTTVHLLNSSQNASSYVWDFGDGNFSTQSSPFHTYASNGSNYVVSLAVTDSTGCSDFMSKSFYAAFQNSISSNKKKVCANDTVLFTSGSMNFPNFSWDFGDGNISAQANPYHVFSDSGNYIVTLTVTDSSGCNQSFTLPYNVEVSKPVANFSVGTMTSNCSWVHSQLTNLSTGSDSWLWDFNDGSTSALQNPDHYWYYYFIGATGPRNITLTAFKGSCSSTIVIPNAVYIANPTIGFTYSQSNECSPVTVSFTDTSNNIVSWFWKFGDGTTSTLKNPTHIYTSKSSGNIELTVTDTNGCQLYVAKPPVTIMSTGFAISDSSGCSPLQVAFTDTSMNTASLIWNFGDGSTDTIRNPIHSFTQNGIYSVSVIYQSLSGCRDTLTIDSLISVSGISPQFTSIYQSQCVPAIIDFTASDSNSVSWNWNFGDGGNSQSSTPTHIYNLSGDYTVTLQVTNVDGCSDSISMTNYIHVSEVTAGFSVSSANGCAPLSVQFTDASLNASQWMWYFGDGDSSTAQNPSHVYNQQGNYTVTLITNDSLGCNDVYTLPSDIIVNQSISASFSVNTSSGCSPVTTSFNNTSPVGLSYQWNFGDGDSSTQFNPSHTYLAAGSYEPYLIVSSSATCTDTAFLSAPVTVNPNPVALFTIGTLQGCSPLTVSFTNQSSSGPSFSYQWNFGDTTSGTNFNEQHQYSAGNYSVSLIVTDVTGCSTSFQSPANITVNNTAVADFSTTDTLGCGPFSVQFSNNSTQATAYSWDFGDGLSSTTSSPVHQYLASGNYYPVLIAANSSGCNDTLIISNPVQVLSSPIADFNFDVAQGCSPITVNFTDYSSDLFNPTYYWDFGNGTTSALQNPSSSYSIPGIYSVKLVVKNGNLCSDSITKTGIINVFNNAPPDSTPIRSVTVTSDSTVDIIWQNSMATDLDRYELYRLDNTAAYQLIYTDTNPNNTGLNVTTTYTDNNLTTPTHTYTYKIIAVDRCENKMPLDSVSEHTTINLTTVGDTNAVKLSWSGYEGCSVNNYQIYRAEVNSPFQLVGSVSGLVLNFIDTLIECPQEYFYRVVATDLCGTTYTSESDISSATPYSDLENQTVDMVRSTVIDNTFILTEWHKPLLAPEKVVHYDLYRSDDLSTYILIASLPAQATSYSDYDVNVQGQNYLYKMDVKNICDIKGAEQNSSSILLKSETDDAGITRLKWTPYRGWDTGIDYYEVQRMDENGVWQTIKVENKNTTESSDY